MHVLGSILRKLDGKCFLAEISVEMVLQKY